MKMIKKTGQIEMDIIVLFNIIKKNKRNYIFATVIGLLIGLIVAFSIPRIYKTNVVLAPETSNSGSLSSSISSLAAMVGMDMQIGNNSDAIYPEIYPDLMKSTDFIVKLFPMKVVSKNGEISSDYYTYMRTMQKIPWWSYPSKMVTDLLESIKKTKGSTGKDVNPFMLSKTQFDVLKKINGNIKCSVDKKTSVITIEVTDQDPVIAATMADSVKNLLQIFITNYRTNKARNDLAYIESLYAESRKQYDIARQKYAAYSDANQEVTLAAYRLKLDDLENEMQLKFNTYTQMNEQLQLSRAKLQERTPAFTVIQSANVPIKHSNTPKVFILAIFIFLANLIKLLIDIYKNFKQIISW